LPLAGPDSAAAEGKLCRSVIPNILATLVETLDLKSATHIGHSTGGGEVARYIGRRGTKRVAKAVLIGAIPPLMLKTTANPGGLPIEVFDQLERASSATARSSGRISACRSDPDFLTHSEYVAQKPANIGLRSQYALRLYSLAKNYVTGGTKRISFEQLRKVLGLESVKGAAGNIIQEAPLAVWANLRQRALDTAIAEINKKTDLNIALESLVRSKHRRVTTLSFAIKAQAVPNGD
jgi:pimeloyl-ACP methyl ester carboxylesterase